VDRQDTYAGFPLKSQNENSGHFLETDIPNNQHLLLHCFEPWPMTLIPNETL